MKKVYYYNDKANVVISQKELRERIQMGECYRLWHIHTPPQPSSWECMSLERPDITTFSYKLNDIPLHPDWETITVDDLTLDMFDYAQLLDVVHNKVANNLVLKLINNIHRMEKYKGINFY